MSAKNRLGRASQTLLATAIAAALPLSANAAAGRVDFAFGKVQATTKDGQVRNLKRGSSIDSGDTIKTRRGIAHLRFSDGSYTALKPNSVFRIDEYAFEEKKAAAGKSFFSILKGGFRSITGLIGRSNPRGYRLRTPVATIGIRGTHPEVEQDADGNWVVRAINDSDENDGPVLVDIDGSSWYLLEPGQYFILDENGNDMGGSFLVRTEGRFQIQEGYPARKNTTEDSSGFTSEGWEIIPPEVVIPCCQEG